MWMSALRRLLFSVVAITSCFHCLDADAASPTEIRDRNKDSTVYIQVSGAGKDGVPYEVDATGFMVSATGEMITASHIFNDPSGHLLNPIKIIGWPGSRYDGRRREIEVLDTAPNLDLSLLRFKGNNTDYKPIQICPSHAMKIGEALIGVGFPKDSELSVINGILSNLSGQRGWAQTNVDFIQGYSGGPVFEADTGSVVGIVMGGTPEVAGRNFYLPINRANGLLSQLSSRPGCSITGKTATISDGNLNYGQSGFSFSRSSLVPWNSPSGDILASTTNPKRDGHAIFFLPNDQPPYNSPQDSKARSGIVQIDEAQYNDQEDCPSDGYMYHWKDAAVNDAYCVRARDGIAYHKIHVKAVTRDFISFEWR